MLPLAGAEAIVQPLRGWKEIAAHSHRSIRSLQREEHLGLPVYRIQGKRGNQVFAYAEEIDAWEEKIAVRYPADMNRFKAKIQSLRDEVRSLKHQLKGKPHSSR